MGVASSDGDVRVLIVDDHQSFGQALALAINFEDGVAAVGSTTDVESAVLRITTDRVDVVVLDYQMPDIDGLEGIRRIKVADRRTRVVMITGHDDPVVHELALVAGATTVLPKQSSVAEIANAVRLASRGRSSMPTPPRAADRQVNLTPRELEVLILLAKGRDAPTIATTLFLSVHTVRGYVKDLLNKLGAHSQLEAVAIARRRGLLPDT